MRKRLLFNKSQKKNISAKNNKLLLNKSFFVSQGTLQNFKKALNKNFQ